MPNFPAFNTTALQDVFMPYLSERCVIERPTGQGASAAYTAITHQDNVPIRREISESVQSLTQQMFLNRGRGNRIINWVAWMPRTWHYTNLGTLVPLNIEIGVGYRIKIGSEAYIYIDASGAEDPMMPLIEVRGTQSI